MTESSRSQGRQLDPGAREAVLRDLIPNYRSMLIAHATRLTGGDRGWAEDVVQETFVRAWRHADRLTPEQGSVCGWLMRVAHNLVVDGYRAARSRPAEVELDEAVPVPAADDSERVLDRTVVARVLAGLPAPQRAALVETYLHDRTAAEAAVVLGVPVGTVKSRVFYALRQLRAMRDDGALAS